MLTIFLTILKILGILLLVVIGLLILGILAILFVPLRYDGKISYNDKNQCVATQITWLFRLICIEGGYQEKVYARARLLWFTLWKWKADEKENDKEDHLESADYSEEELDRLLEERSQKEESKEETKEETKEAKVIEETLDEPDAEENLTEVQPTEIEPKEVELNEAKSKEAESNKAESKEKKPKKIQFQQIGKRIKEIKEKIKHIKEMASDQRIHRAILLLIDGAWKMVRHSLPRKIKGRAKFGFEDPSTTGQILTYVSLLYPCYAKSVELVPMFTEKVIDLDLYFRGRVRLFSLIWICVKIWFDRNFRYLYKKVRKKK
ncbi:MAG: hypothetical protein HXM41_05610 [Lachnospiraceae bacterium]|jgi:hypothetical protein|nr:hypothetical protein [Lachnospiraceae bacterium]